MNFVIEQFITHYKLLIVIDMFGLFKKKSEKQKLQERYKKLMEEAHKLSHTNRKLSDIKVFEAERIMDQIERLD